MGYRTCYYRTFNVGRATDSQRDAYKQARAWMDAGIDLVADLAARAVAAAVRDGVREAEGIPGCPADPRARALAVCRT